MFDLLMLALHMYWCICVLTSLSTCNYTTTLHRQHTQTILCMSVFVLRSFMRRPIQSARAMDFYYVSVLNSTMYYIKNVFLFYCRSFTFHPKQNDDIFNSKCSFYVKIMSKFNHRRAFSLTQPKESFNWIESNFIKVPLLKFEIIRHHHNEFEMLWVYSTRKLIFFITLKFWYKSPISCGYMKLWKKTVNLFFLSNF